MRDQNEDRRIEFIVINSRSFKFRPICLRIFLGYGKINSINYRAPLDNQSNYKKSLYI
jgi:hypothetical protein